MVESAMSKTAFMSILLKSIAVLISFNAGNAMVTVKSARINECAKLEQVEFYI